MKNADKITIYDIAREAEVSISTVSRVINNIDGVSNKKRERIQKIFDKYNYIPSPFARGLVNRNTMKTVGILIWDIRSEHHASIAYTIEQEFSRRGYCCILCSTGNEAKNQERYFQMISQREIDGIILVGSVFQSVFVEKLIEKYLPKIPVVITNGVIERDNVYSIVTDESKAVEKCVNLLFEKNRKKIVFVEDDTSNSIKEKEKGYLRALEKLNLLEESLVVKTTHEVSDCRAACDKILAENPDVNAIICAEDITAMAIIAELSKLGKKVPDDIAVIGCNNSKFAEICYPQLTSVNNNQGAVGTTAARTLCDILESHEAPHKTMIMADIVCRESTP